MNLILKRDPVWLECLPTPDARCSATLLLLGGDGQQVAVSVPLLLAVSPVVRRILTDHLPPAYSPCCLSLPATTGDVLQVFGDILATGAAAGAHEDKKEEVRQVFEMLGVEALIVSCHLQSIQVGQVLVRDIKKESSTEVSRIGLNEENTCQLEIFIKIEPKENIGVKVDSEESESFEIGQPCRQKMTKKSSLNFQQSNSSTTSDKSGNLKNNAHLSESKKRKKSPLSPILSHPTLKKSKHPTTCKSTAPHVRRQSLVPGILRFAPVTQRIPIIPPTAFKAPKSNCSDKPPKSPGSLKLVHNCVQFLCNLCPKKFVQKGHLLRHVQSVHDKIELACKLCPEKFKRSDSLLIHVKSVHDKILVLCNFCTRKFTHKSNLKKHVESVHHKIEIPCKLCPKKFAWRDSLIKHVKSVHEKIEIPCKLCPKKFTRRDSLSKHVKTVHDKISIEAVHDKSLIPRNLCTQQLHMRNKYPCILCTKTFTTKSSVVRHIKSDHDKKSIEPVC